MQFMLSDIKSGVKELLEDSPYSPSVKQSQRKLTTEDKRAKSKSAWAKSRTPRAEVLTAADAVKNSEIPIPFAKAKNATTEGYTIPRAKLERFEILTTDENYEHKFYDVNIDNLSNRKRTLTVKISSNDSVTRPFHGGKTGAPQIFVINGSDNGEIKSGCFGQDSTRSISKRPRQELVTTRPPTGGGFSFSRSERKIDSVQLPITALQAPLDVESAEKWIRPKSAIAVIAPEGSTQSRLKAQCPLKPDEPMECSPSDDIDASGSSSAEKNGRDIQKDVERDVPAFGCLSHHSRSPAVTLYHEPHKQKKAAVMARLSAGSQTPGPGHYDMSAVSALATVADPKKGVIYHTKLSVSDSERAAKVAVASATHSPGPGDYDLEAAQKAVRKGTAGVVMHNPESKPTPQLLRMQYWEAKARDAREEHDDLREANADVGRARTPTVVIRPDKKAGVSWKNRHVIEERLIEQQRRQQLAYDVDYGAVDTRPKTGVHMAQEVAVKDSLHQRARNKPGLVEIEAAKEREKAHRDRFLGPNLQVDWIPRSKGKAVGANQEEEDGHESPIEEVMALLRTRAGAKSGIEKAYEDSAAAYLRSSLSGAPYPTPVIIRPPTARDKRNPDMELPPEAQNREYLTTQLQPDWKAEAESRTRRHKGPAADMSLRPGREIISIARKGERTMKEFGEGVEATDDLGPGAYDVTGFNFGEGMTSIDFSKVTAREDAVGPNGERAARLQADELELKLEYDGETDIDSRVAKDSELVKKSRTQSFQFDRMTGRAAADDVVGESIDQLDLEVKDWNPHKTNEHAGIAWTDAKADPRFRVAKKTLLTEDAKPLSPRDVLTKPRPKLLTNFDTQSGRRDTVHEDAALEDVVGVGRMDEALAADQLLDRDEGLRKGFDAHSGNTKAIAGVNMEKQTKRKGLERVTDAPDKVYQVSHVAVEERGGRGVVSWALEADVIDETDRLLPDSGAEEVIVSPRHFAQSKYRSAVKAPDWSKQSDDARPQDEPPVGSQLQYDVGAALDLVRAGSRVRTVDMDKQQPRTRADVLSEDPLLGVHAADMLDLDPASASRALDRRSVTVGDWKKESDVSKSAGIVDLADEIGVPPTENVLILESHRSDPRLQSRGNHTNFAKQLPRALDDNFMEDYEGVDVLQLDPKINRPKTRHVCMTTQTGRDHDEVDAAQEVRLDLSAHDVRADWTKKKKKSDWRRSDDPQLPDNEVAAMLVTELGAGEQMLALSPRRAFIGAGADRNTSDWRKKVTFTETSEARLAALVMSEVGAFGEELVLEPGDSPKARGSVKGAVHWTKQLASNADHRQEADIVMAELGAEREELDINPRSAPKKRSSGDGSADWKKLASDTEDVKAALFPDDGDELGGQRLQLSPKLNLVERRGARALAWDTQARVRFDAEELDAVVTDLGVGLDQLKLSPKYPGDKKVERKERSYSRRKVIPKHSETTTATRLNSKGISRQRTGVGTGAPQPAKTQRGPRGPAPETSASQGHRMSVVEPSAAATTIDAANKPEYEYAVMTPKTSVQIDLAPSPPVIRAPTPVGRAPVAFKNLL